MNKRMDNKIAHIVVGLINVTLVATHYIFGNDVIPPQSVPTKIYYTSLLILGVALITTTTIQHLFDRRRNQQSKTKYGYRDEWEQKYLNN